MMGAPPTSACRRPAGHRRLLNIWGAFALAMMLGACSFGRSLEGDGCGRESGCEWPLATVPLTLSAEELRESPVRFATIDFPDGIRQEEGSWFRLDLEIAFTVDPLFAEGDLEHPAPAFLSAAVDGGTAFQLKLAPAPSDTPRCEGAPRQRLEWSTFGLVDGDRRELVPCDGSVHFEFSNYLQTRSVHPGKVDVSLQLESPGPQPLRSLTVFPHSRVVRTRQGPPVLEIRPERVRVRRSEEGDEALLEISILVDGVRSDDAVVTVGSLDEGGALAASLPAIWTGAGYSATVPLESGSGGAVLVSATAARASGVELVSVTAARRGPFRGAAGWALVIGGALMAAGLLLPFISGRFRVARCGARHQVGS